MPVPRKIRRRRPSSEVTVEQTHDAAVIAAMLEGAVTSAPADATDSGECFLIAYVGDDPVGIAGVETEVDAALMRPLFVVERMRQRGVGACLVSAVRRAAHTRGARVLYAIVPATLVHYFARLGFTETSISEFDEVLGQRSMLQRTKLDPAVCRPVRLDLSRDGLVER